MSRRIIKKIFLFLSIRLFSDSLKAIDFNDLIEAINKGNYSNFVNYLKINPSFVEEADNLNRGLVWHIRESKMIANKAKWLNILKLCKNHIENSGKNGYYEEEFYTSREFLSCNLI